MAQVTLGGDRLGSGNKQKVALHNYEMTSFNLSQKWTSSMAPGILYPCLKLVGTNHGTFDIDVDSFIRTLPTKGPLFGSFKFQVDIFSVPMRLYQGILHNNPIKIGMNMNKVYLPKLEFFTRTGASIPRVAGTNKYNYQVNESSLMKYMGFSGAGEQPYGPFNGPAVTVRRKINAIPFLAYYDIFKNYYANKQEDKAYVITSEIFKDDNNYGKIENIKAEVGDRLIGEFGPSEVIPTIGIYDYIFITIVGSNLLPENIKIEFTNTQTSTSETLNILVNDNAAVLKENTSNKIVFAFNYITMREEIGQGFDNIQINTDDNLQVLTSDIKLQEFDLANIDEMRNRLLGSSALGEEFVINAGYDLLPYSILTQTTSDGVTYNAFEDNGLMVKTYQSDLFNNWLNTEFIDGENGISALSSVAVTNGTFTMDQLNLAEKKYELLNRILVSGGTYEDWQEAVYGEGAVRKAETPMYVGGMQAEVMFEEVVSSSETEVKGDFQALGALGGKGTIVGQEGGKNIHIKCEEPTYIIGICSLTPRINYSQGNDWDLTELDTLDDLHKPALDGIGFQDLITEQMAWWDTTVTDNPLQFTKHSAGKQTAWINYQTAVDKCYGDFAREAGKAFMVLNRNYEMDSNGRLSDLTTYIDPAKFNYAFAYTDLASQNFWTQLAFKIVARRKMGAQQIPNL